MAIKSVLAQRIDEVLVRLNIQPDQWALKEEICEHEYHHWRIELEMDADK